MRHYYIYIPTANAFTSSDKQPHRADYFYIGKFDNEEAFNAALKDKVREIHIGNNSLINRLDGSPYDDNTKELDKADTPLLIRGLLCEELLIRSQLEFQFRQKNLN